MRIKNINKNNKIDRVFLHMIRIDEEDEYFMQHALMLAQRAEQQGEVPVGAVLVRQGHVIGEGWNQPIGMTDPTAHAEIMALRDAAEREQNYRLPGTTLYVTLEPCPMCAGAIVHARVSRVVYAAPDPKGGAAGSVFDLLPTDGRFNHQVEVYGGLMLETSARMLQEFFRHRRAKSNARD
jgi:tRNA(adenine34) deaminase